MLLCLCKSVRAGERDVLISHDCWSRLSQALNPVRHKHRASQIPAVLLGVWGHANQMGREAEKADVLWSIQEYQCASWFFPPRCRSTFTRGPSFKNLLFHHTRQSHIQYCPPFPAPLAAEVYGHWSSSPASSNLVTAIHFSRRGQEGRGYRSHCRPMVLTLLTAPLWG